MPADLRIHPVSGKQDLKTFIRVPFHLYGDDPNWVPPLQMDQLDKLRPDKNPYFKHAEAKYWIAYKEGRPIGRISAQIDKLALKHINPAMGHIGMFECENDSEAAKALFDTAESWLADAGMTHVQGPFNLSINEECGLLVDGFNTPPMVMMGHARPYYRDLFASCGYEKAKDMYAYTLSITKGFSEKTQRIVRIAENNAAIEIRDLDMRHYNQELEAFFSIFNDAWSGNWGFLPFTGEEAHHAAKAMKPVMNPRWVRICAYKGEQAAFMVTIPDVNSLIRDFSGKLFPFNFLKLIWRLKMKPVKRVRVPLMGVRKHLQGTIGGASMVFLLIETIRRQTVKDGCEEAELSWILENNKAMNKILIDIGCKIYKTYRIFEKMI